MKLINFCLYCNKKTILLFKYHCGGNFCLKHRNAESHECQFDYKCKGKEILKINNPVVIKDKVPNRIQLYNKNKK